MLNCGGVVFVWGPVTDLDAAIRAYLKDTLGIDAPTAPWLGAASLPYFLVDAFDLKALTMLGRPVLLAIDKRADRPGLATIRAQIDRIREGSGLPVLYATGVLASFERKRLIEQKVPFVVPGNQLYLPDLGVELREYFHTPAPQPQGEISPAAQAMLIAVLLGKPWRGEWEPADVLGRLGYTAMTASRAAREVVAAGIARSEMVGKLRRLKACYGPHSSRLSLPPYSRVFRASCPEVVSEDSISVGTWDELLARTSDNAASVELAAL